MAKNTISSRRGRQLHSPVKDMYTDENGKLVLELGTMASEYITRGDWNVTDSSAILASKTYYTLKLRTLLNMKFRYAKRGSFYNPSFSLLAEKIGFSQYANKRDGIRRMKEILESLSEVEYVTVRMKKDGRKIVDANFDIAPSDDFISSIINANALNKRAKNALIDDNQENVLIEPMEHEFKSSTEFKKAQREFDTRKGKILFANRHLKNNQ